MSAYLYIDENGAKHFPVIIHNFDKLDTDKVRIMGNCRLNPTDRTYPDKKWVKKSDLFVQAEFTDEFIKQNSF